MGVLSPQLSLSADRASFSVVQGSAPTRPTSVMATMTAKTTPMKPIVVQASSRA